MNTNLGNRESEYSHCYYKETLPFFNYDHIGYGIKKKHKAIRVNPKKDKWRIKIYQSVVNEDEKRFLALAEKWKDETGFYSTTHQKVYNKNYLTIISMGMDVLPYILKDLKNGGTWHWHTALSIIADYNPLPKEELNNGRKLKDAWIRWGESQNLL